MNIKILDSWLRDYLETKATPEKIGELLSLSSITAEHIESYSDDFIYDFEITSNRVDLMSILGIARETVAVLNQNGIKAKLNPLKLEEYESSNKSTIRIVNDNSLVNRVCAIVMDVSIAKTPKIIKERLEASGIRSLNNLIDITNYVMRTIGHPTHVFDFDRLNTNTITIRQAKKGEQIETLDNKIYALKGGEIIGVNDKNEIIDLLGIMGLSNSVVTNETKRILFFVNNNKPTLIRKASMNLNIRTEAAVINEKNLDSELSKDALLYGMQLYKQYANGKIASKIIDIYPNKPDTKEINVSFKKIDQVLGVTLQPKKIYKILTDLDFKTQLTDTGVSVTVPSRRIGDMEIEEDVIEEIARIYGYHNLPNILPSQNEVIPRKIEDNFYWERKIKQSMKYLGYTEVYSYSFVSEQMFEGPTSDAVEIANPLNVDFIYMRNSLVPSLLEIANVNKNYSEVKIFEIANVYLKRPHNLPIEKLHFAGVYKKEGVNFYEIKGLIEAILEDLGITNIIFKPSQKYGSGSSVYIKDEYLGEIDIFNTEIIDFELDFSLILKYANNKKIFKQFAKFPPIIEDLTIIADKNISTLEIQREIQEQSNIISEVSLKDDYENTRTFHIIYQDPEKTLTKNEISEIHNKIIESLKNKFKASIK